MHNPENPYAFVDPKEILSKSFHDSPHPRYNTDLTRLQYGGNADSCAIIATRQTLKASSVIKCESY